MICSQALILFLITQITFSIRQLINAACVRHFTPLVSRSALKFDSQVSVFDPRNSSAPCSACIISPDEQFEEVSCSSMGVFSSLVDIIEAIQAAQALHILVGFGESLVGRMLLWNGRTTQVDEIRMSRNTECSICGTSH
ncbi:HesA/MoeB/ThiF family protein [Polynucleobacter necessarius]|uniref:HesA/MoeB/ThiF family protein n=1 Tax=Polynucleobacter necessarius TaxID=576610 RepID=UPI002F958CA3